MFDIWITENYDHYILLYIYINLFIFMEKEMKSCKLIHNLMPYFKNKRL